MHKISKVDAFILLTKSIEQNRNSKKNSKIKRMHKIIMDSVEKDFQNNNFSSDINVSITDKRLFKK